MDWSHRNWGLQDRRKVGITNGFQEACGEFWGFQAGWWRTISIYIDNTLYVILAGGYIANTWDLSPTMEMAFKIGMILVFTYINIRGVKDVGLVSTILSVLVIVAFGLVAICGFMNWTHNPFVPFTADGEIMGITGIAPSDWVYYIGMGIALGMWMYSGYESMSTIAGEVSNPQVIHKSDAHNNAFDHVRLYFPYDGRPGFFGRLRKLGVLMQEASAMQTLLHTSGARHLGFSS